LVQDCLTRRVLASLEAPSGRAFNGHGCFSPDGARRFTSEQVAEGSAGRIGIWLSGSTCRRIGEWDSGGIGPHDLRWHPASGGLVIANGGLRTDPTDRTKLNTDSMRPNPAFLTDDGVIAEVAAFPGNLHQLSIRHPAIAPDGTVPCALQ